MYILSQIFVVISGILFAASYLIKKKESILIINIFNNLFFSTHFLLLKSYTATITNFLTIFFLLAIYFVEKKKKGNLNFIIVSIFSLILIPITISTWDGIVTLLPLSASLLFFLASALKNTLAIKMVYFISTISNTIFMFIIHSYFGFGVNICILITAVVGIIKELINIKNKKLSAS